MHIYFSGIGGSGLSGLAHLALDLGWMVSGSDLESGEIVKKLQLRGAKITLTQSLENITKIHSQKPIDWFLHTAALKPNHTELQFVNQNNWENNQIKFNNKDINLVDEKVENLPKNFQKKIQNEENETEENQKISKNLQSLDNNLKVEFDQNQGKNDQKSNNSNWENDQETQNNKNIFCKNKISGLLQSPSKNANQSQHSQDPNLEKSQPSPKIKISKRDELINFIITEKNLKLIAIAGTHGKTTTTAMLVWLFKTLQIPVSYLVGSEISFGNSGQFEQSEYFVLECDEFDRNFLKFYPEIAIIPSLDFDHPDIYTSQNDYNEAFRQFWNQVKTQIIPKSGIIEKLIKTSPRQKIFDNKVVKVFEGFGESLEKIHLVGLHNRQNAELVLMAMSIILGIQTDQKILEIGFAKYQLFEKISTFPGTSRRFEKLADFIYSDYAHHPSEIAATLELATEIAKSQNTKTKN